ncbi:hypothetical protein K488DRAFT_91054 [Vararia minispora EC-137]|uniref:Uncharacterized protein n=1 Tax=Vararia minispora EC-137 TaxID=1314806 RepID=A0ACB8Q6F0_9AGAM|nr:hypothetical protein K488DRAFT_91054 [Vararia minispora EC-137]
MLGQPPLSPSNVFSPSYNPDPYAATGVGWACSQWSGGTVHELYSTFSGLHNIPSEPYFKEHKQIERQIAIPPEHANKTH